MRFFFRKKDNSYPSKQIKKFIITLSNRDYADFNGNDTYIKFWIPESIEKLIDEITDLMDTSMSDFIRQVLFLHLYGRHDLLGHRERGCGIYLKEQIDFCVGDQPQITPPPVDKNIADIKVWLPPKMKGDLQMLADRQKTKLSVYVRQVLQTHLLGVMPYEPGLADQQPPEGFEDE